MTEHTKGPWVVSEYSDTGGYDCMTGGLQVGRVTLDGADYGQEWNAPENADCPPQMMADAHLIAAAPDLLECLKWAMRELEGQNFYDEDVADQQLDNCYDLAYAAIAKATNPQPSMGNLQPPR